MFAVDGAMFGGIAIVWLLSLGVTLLALLSFFRGMRALVQIADRLAGIERALAERPRS